MKSPLGLVNLATAVKQFPQETLGAIQDYPEEYLRWYDERTRHERLCGIAANDAHHNQTLRLLVTPDRGVKLVDGLGKEMLHVGGNGNTAIAALLAGRKPGDVLVDLDLDPYDRSLFHVCTHVWLRELSEGSVREALREGRAYVAFDWLGDPTGFVFVARDSAEESMPGSERRWTPNLELIAETSLPVEYRLWVNGRELIRSNGREFRHKVAEPGVYRIEAWLTLAGEPRPWILSNPIYVRAAK